VEFKGLAANLSDEQYAKLAEFKIEPLMQVDDEVSGVHGTGAKREDGSVYIEERGKRKGNSAKAMEAKPKPAAPKSSDQPNKPPASKPSDGKSTAKNLTYTGQVTDKLTSKAIAGAIVAVRRQIVAPYEQRILDESTHTTDAAGKYTFTIPPEQVVQGHLFIEVEVSHPSYMMRKDGYGFSMIHRNEQLGQRPFFEHIELNPAEQVSGTVVTPDGKPAAGIKVIGFTMPDRHDIDSHSFPETITDANGGFRLNLAKGCPAVFWLLPKGHALATHVIGTRRGDMGRMTLGTGAVVKGRVVDEEGKPVHGVWVNAAMIDGPGREILVQLADPLERSALTDEEGEFTLAPLPAGECLVVVSERPGDRLQDRQALRPLSNVFRHTRLKLNGESTVPLEIRAVPQVVVEGQYRDRFGKPRSGHQPYLLGEIDDKTLGDQHGYVAYGVIDEGGHFVVRAPNGLKNARLHLSTTEHCSLRVRMTKDGPLINPRSEIDLGTLEHDIRGIEAIRYNAPVVLAKGVDEDGKTIKGFQVELKYVRESMQMHGPRFLREDGKPAGDVSFSRQDDGRLRSEQLLPDEEFTLTVEAEGYEPKSEKLELPEGATKELEVKLKERV
jgi:protocatechuate 3,4-dioxygenase beta subunit